MCASNHNAQMRLIPGVDRLIDAIDDHDLPRAVVLDVIRQTLKQVRSDIRTGHAVNTHIDALAMLVQEQLAATRVGRIQPVINATGVIIHTNLGRSPMAHEAVQAASQAAEHYVNLEMDLTTGRRGVRAAQLERSLALLCEAQAATVVNNCAAALALTVWQFVADEHPEIIISRGEMVQIGGGFRIPELLETAGAMLREVGTTNKTTLVDYELALGPQTAMILKVHRSNFYMDGFVESPSSRDIAELAQREGKVFVEDLGGGAMFPTEALAGEHEPTPASVLEEGADVVCFSGDKLLGGPQAGIIAGRADLIKQLKANPLFRALRCDKMCLAALQETVSLHLSRKLDDIPILAMINSDLDSLRRRAERVISDLKDLPVDITIADSVAKIGGGSLPRTELPSVSLDLKPHGMTAGELSLSLSVDTPPCICQVVNEHVRLDLRTVPSKQVVDLVSVLKRCLIASSS